MGFSLLLSVLPLPDGARPFPTLRKDPKHAVLTALWPRAVQKAPPKALAVLEEQERQGEVEAPEPLPAATEDGGTSRQPPPLTPRERAQRRAWTNALEQLSAPGSAVVDPCLEWTTTGCAASGLDPFFASLDEVRQGKRQVSRIVVFGTSLIASDHITDVARQVLQREHGNAGRGLLYVDRPTRGAGRTVRTGEASEEWEIDKLTDEKPRDDLGLTGVAFTSPPDKPQTVKFDVRGQAVAQVYAYAEPKGGDLALELDGQPAAKLSVAGDQPEPVFFRVALEAGAKKLALQARGKVRVDAVALESAQPGVVLDSLGLPGSSARVLLRANEDVFRAQLGHRDPSLVVVMMGGNEAYELSEGRYGDAKARATLEALLDRVRQVVPRAACLLASPPDAGIFKLDRTIAFREQTRAVAKLMRETAQKKGCGYYDMQAAMGGEGAIARWYDAKLMNEDLVHPLGAGGDLMGWQFATALEQARLKRKLATAITAKSKSQPRVAPLLRPLGAVPGPEPAAADGGRTRRRTRDGGAGQGPADGGSQLWLLPDGGVRLRRVPRPGPSDGGVSVVVLTPDGGVRRRREPGDGGSQPGLLPDGGVRRRREPGDGGANSTAFPDGGVRRRREPGDGGASSTAFPDGGVRQRREPGDGGASSTAFPGEGVRRQRGIGDGGSQPALLPDGGVRRRRDQGDGGAGSAAFPDGGVRRQRGLGDGGSQPGLLPDGGGRRRRGPGDAGAPPVLILGEPDGGAPRGAGDFIVLPDGTLRARGGVLPDGGLAGGWILLPDGEFRRRQLDGDAASGRAALAQQPGIENAAALEPFFQKLHLLEREKQGRVAVAQLGASHTASHFFTDEARALMAARFGYAGRGYIAAGKPSNRLEAAGVSRTLLGRWEVKDAVRTRALNQPWGLTGTRATGGPGASVTIRFDEPVQLEDDTSRIQVFLLETPDGGRGEVLVDGLPAAARAPAAGGASRVGILDLAVPGAPHAITVRNAGPGRLSVLGISHELLRPGVVWDSLGLPASTVVTLSRFEPQALEAQLKARQPSLFVMFYGTNEAARPARFLEKVRTAWPQVLASLKRSSPDAACVLLGPTDRLQRRGGRWLPAPSTREVYGVLRAVAREHGCAVWSAYDSMGGEGSIAAWRSFEPPWAHKDRVHLTHPGYRALAGAFVGDLLSAYDTWRAAR